MMVKIFLKRIIRALKFIPIFLKESWIEPGESCRICGRVYRESYTVNDELWMHVNGQNDGCLCPSCFLREKQKHERQ
jgi:hypothetical protein